MCDLSVIPISKPVARYWKDRLSRLRSSLEKEPHNPQVWLWQIRIRILSFLMTRYGHRTNLTWIDLKPHHSIAAYQVPPTGKLPRTSEMFRPVLQRIAEINRERRN